MKRVEITEPFTTLLAGAKRTVDEVKAQAVVLLTDLPYDFAAIRNELHPVRLVVATDKVELFRPVLDDDVDLVPLVQEPESRRLQLSQALLEAIADELLQTGDMVVALYPGFEMHDIDTCSVISLGEHLSRLTSRDLQRLETQVPLETLRTVVDLAIEIGREGREGKPVGTLFVVGNHRKVLKMSHEQVHDPFRGYAAKERQIKDPRVRESVKEISQLDGAFIISADGIVQSDRTASRRPGRRDHAFEGPGGAALGGRCHVESHQGHHHRRLGIDRHRANFPGWKGGPPRRADAPRDEMAELRRGTDFP